MCNFKGLMAGKGVVSPLTFSSRRFLSFVIGNKRVDGIQYSLVVVVARSNMGSICWALMAPKKNLKNVLYVSLNSKTNLRNKIFLLFYI